MDRLKWNAIASLLAQTIVLLQKAKKKKKNYEG